MNVYRVNFGTGGRERKLVIADDYRGAEAAFRNYALTREFTESLMWGITFIEKLETELVDLRHCGLSQEGS